MSTSLSNIKTNIINHLSSNGKQTLEVSESILGLKGFQFFLAETINHQTLALRQVLPPTYEPAKRIILKGKADLLGETDLDVTFKIAVPIGNGPLVVSIQFPWKPGKTLPFAFASAGKSGNYILEQIHLEVTWMGNNGQDKPQFYCILNGNMNLSDKLKAPMQIRFPAAPHSVAIQSAFPEPHGLPSLQELAAIARTPELATWLPASIAEAKGLRLDQVGIMYNTQSNKATYFNLAVSADGWELVKNAFAVKDLRFSIMASFAEKSTALTTELDADLVIKALRLPLSIRIEPNKISIGKSSTERFLGPSIEDLMDAIGGHEIKKSLPAGFKLDTPISIDTLEVGINPKTKQLTNLYFCISISNIQLDGFTLNYIGMGFQRDIQNSNANAASYQDSGYILSTMSLGVHNPIVLKLSANLTSSPNSTIWQFEASAQNVNVGRLIKSISEVFGADIDLPNQLMSLVIDKLSLSFSKSSQKQQSGQSSQSANLDYTFICNIKYPKDGGKADLNLTIQLSTDNLASTNPNVKIVTANSNTPVPSWTKRAFSFSLEAELTIDKKTIEIDLNIDQNSQENLNASVIVAKNPKDYAFDLHTFMGSISTNQDLIKLIPTIEIIVKQALLAYLKENSPAPIDKYLFSIALDLSLDLKKLPLAGSLLPSDRPFQIKDLQFLYATPTGLDQTEVQAINQYLPANAQIPETPITQSTNTPPANLPAAQTQTLVLKPGLNFRANVQLGGAPQSLSLPSGEAPPAAPQAPQQQQQQPDKSQQSETSAPPPAVQWIDIQKSLGPITVNRIGGSFHDKKLWFVVDAALVAGGLTISLDGLGIGSPVEQFDLSKISAAIQGMSLTYNQPPVEISGGFLARDNFKTFAGEALIKTGTFAISAFGMYQKKTDPKTKEDYTSAFIFARLDTPLGGPPPFFVTGLCGGFGYNNRVNVPPVEQLQDFSFVQGALPPGPKNNDPFAGDAKNDPGKILDKLMSGPKPEIVPEPKEKWLAAGVKFTSFDLINSIAVLIVEFGNELEIDLVGLSSISMPPPAAPGATEPVKQYAYAELAIKMKLLPTEGAFTAKAVLTPNSFVLDPACKLTGGFGFYFWFGNNPHAGEFVLTLGGYHPEFAAPIYYPRVDRLGFNWPMPEGVTITGDAYFALTASAIMAGGGLSILYVNGNLRAWFIARVDALISWAPFFYSIGMKVSIGVSYLVKALFVSKTFKVELGASLYISGPKLKGKAHISWYVISRTVEFGAKKAPEPPLLKWTTDDGKGFAQTLLPHSKEEKQIKTGKLFMITVKDGLTKTLDDGTWVIRPNHFEFSVQTVIPATRVDIALDNNSGKKSQPAAYTTVGIRPMGATLSESAFTITVKKLDRNENYDLPAHFDFEYATQKVPAAKWGAPLGEKEEPKKNELLPDRLMGIDQVKPKTAVLTPSGANKLEFDLNKALQYVPINKNKPAALPLKRQADDTPLPKAQPDTMMKTIQSSLQNTAIQGIRTDIFKALQEYGAHPGKGAPKTDGFAANPKAYLYGNPLIKA